MVARRLAAVTQDILFLADPQLALGHGAMHDMLAHSRVFFQLCSSVRGPQEGGSSFILPYMCLISRYPHCFCSHRSRSDEERRGGGVWQMCVL